MIKKKNKEYLKKISQEILKLWFVFCGMFIVVGSAGFAGYGYLHYAQGVFMMSSPILLLNSYIFGAAIAFILTLLYDNFYKDFCKKLKKGDL